MSVYNRWIYRSEPKFFIKYFEAWINIFENIQCPWSTCNLKTICFVTKKNKW